MRRKRLGLLALATILLGACGTSEGSDQETTTPKPSETGASSTSAEEGPTCELIDAEEAIVEGLEKFQSSEQGWQDPIASDPSMVEGFDTCAPLEVVALHSDDGSENAPMALMLFHEGEFIGPATSSHFPNVEVSRIGENTIRAIYTADRPGGLAGSEVIAHVSTFSWDEQQKKVVWAGQMPSYEFSPVAIPVEAFKVPEAVKTAYGPNLPVTALPMEFQIPSQIPELNMNWDDTLDDPQAAIAAPKKSTICNIAWDNMYCLTPGVEWPIEPLDLGGKTIANTHYHVLGPSTKADLDYGIEIGAVGGPVSDPVIELAPGEARYFNNFMCVSSGTDLTCWEALTGSGFIVDDGEFTAF